MTGGAPGVLVAVTNHAVERFRQRVPQRTGELDTKAEIVARVSRAWQAGRATEEPPPGATGERGSVYVRDLVDRDLLFVCRHDRPRGELVVVTLWEPGRIGTPRVPRRYTDAVRERDSGRKPRH